MDIYEIPLYYISFNKKQKLENELINTGFKNINYYEAVNGKKLNIDLLVKNNMISSRTYIDLIDSRHQHSGIPSLGAIGCYMSHYNLWKECVSNNLAYITIVEDDVNINKISEKNIDKITNILLKPNSIFVSSNVKKNKITYFQGTQFYIASNDACKNLIKKAFPIDVQLDYYMSYIDTLKQINIEGFKIFKQKIHISSIQDVCIKCFLPNNMKYYIIILIITFIIFIIFIIFKLKK
jgi:GR25 family glycosyltransferase involved in LPS biosynthesis